MNSHRWTPPPRLAAAIQHVNNPNCEECGEPVAETPDHHHDGHAWCRTHLHHCRECLDALRDGFYGA